MSLVPTAVYAQASLAGTVRDTTGAVLPGVTVEASSPALIERVRSAVTDETGQYRIVDLRPGAYTMTFTLGGFNTVVREGIELRGAFTATVNAELQVGTIEDKITVTGASPIVDIQNVRQQRILSKDVIDTLPTARTPLALSVLVPGVTVTAADHDVGGTNTVRISTATVHGSRAQEYRQLIDGFGIGTSYANLTSMAPILSSAQEMTIDVAAGSAEQGAGGVVLNIIPKEGGNRFTGSLFAAGTTDGLQGSNFTQRVKDRGLRTATSIKNNYEISPAFGGPIVRDRIWFFTAASTYGQENYVGGMFYNRNAGDPNAWTYVADPDRPAYIIGWHRGANGRLTWQIDERHKIAGYYDYHTQCRCQQTSPTISPEAAPEFYYPRTDLGTVTWSFPMTSRLLLQAGAAVRREDAQFYVRKARWPEYLAVVPVLDVATGLLYRAPRVDATRPLFGDRVSRMPKLRGSLTFISGAHELKTGFDNDATYEEDFRTDNASSLSYTFSNGMPISLTEFAVPIPQEQRNPLNLGVYAQDKWTIKRLTLTGGLRFEWYTTSFPDHHFGPGPVVPARSFTIPGRDVYNTKDLSPRLGVAYDLFGNGRTALKASANRYLLTLANPGDVPGSAGSWYNGNPSFSLARFATRAWSDRNGNFVPDCDLTVAAATGECGPLSNSRFGQLGSQATFDPETYRGFGNRPYHWEFSTSIQQQLLSNVSVDIGYFRRVYGNLLVTDNRALKPSDYDTYSITAPLDPRLPGGGGYVISGLYDLNPQKLVGGIPVDPYVTFASNYGKQYEHWNGLDVQLNARLPNGVFLAGGMSTGRTTTDNCDVVSQLGTSPSQAYPAGGTALLPFQDCHIQTNFLTQMKAFGAYTIPRVDVQVAGTFQSFPGQEILALYNVPSTVVAQTLGRPLSGGAQQVTVNLVPPGTMYGERLNQLDLRVGKILTFGRTRTTLNLDVYNLLNVDTVMTQSNAYAIWQRAQSLIMARFAKLSMQVDF
jgi:hypothetical protein